MTKVRHLVAGFYAGDESLTGPLSWWLTFEMWKQSLSHAGGE
jgi:hypothetical protein